MKRLRLLPIALVPAVVLGLAACSGSGSGDASASPSASSSASAAPISTCPKPGSASKSIKVTGAVGGKEAPTVTFDKGLSAKTPQASTVAQGDGAKLQKGEFAQVSYAVYQAKDASKLGAVGFDQGNPQVLSVGGTGFGALLACTKVGDRVAAIGASSALGFTTSGDIVVVADVIAKTPTKATGTPQQQDPALPTVKDKADGEPEITIPSGYKAPATTQVEVLKQGDGPEVQNGDSALVQYKGVLLDGGKEFDSSWSKGAPTTFTVSEQGLIKGFVTGLVGQKVGSQVLIVATAEDAYGANPREGSGIPANAPLVFVVDILALG
ncbi:MULTISPECIES: FKBP-type peptidyl-prolyl cis-trans isomerase [unclassified Curtobacterium]|uniref:FKBP-type peptidyl-prolyl cis-trans isomerase n=1 Tax=unclassified Curtobacterium TaxID=257496 RepID=UPI0008DD4C42|nr:MULTISPECIES: FKBP-type peptidyl-prolyl cis-trans isomerase [unclassified Curtobacterium]WIA95405.1 FKBP-type peptidyl-prolyl cis-trans isomerase [Curtobacterium sp. MCBA15_004]WIA98771.1 FKBP-type peptidyl-prolyl cis-trans isomerase [Curtobacterium sp. MCBA15_012]